MDLFGYCYNIIFVLFFSVALSSCFMAYGVTKQKNFRWFGVLLLTYIFESVFVAIFTVLNQDGPFFVAYFSGLVLFTGIEIYFIGKIVYGMFGRENSRNPIWIALAAAFFAAGGVMIGGRLGWFINRTSFNVFIFLLCVIYHRLLKQAQDTPFYEPAKRWSRILSAMELFSVLSVVEPLLYLLVLHEWVDAFFSVYRNYISFFSDAFCLILSIWLAIFSRREQERYISQNMEETLQQRMSEFQAQAQEKQKKISAEQIVEFGKYYGLTERETEILRLILEGKSNQEISQALYITIGTVKTHIHSIFSKLEVSRRGQLMSRFVNHTS